MPPAKSSPSQKPKAAVTRTALVVAGMHRSGTSALARVLSLAGGRLPERVMDPGPDNPLGFWEPWEMVGLNDAILAAAGSRWDDALGHRAGPAAWEARSYFEPTARAFVKADYGAADFAILKDPRASLLMRFWDHVLEGEGLRPLHIIMVRHPLEVAASIAKRGGGSAPASVLAWISHMTSVERDTRGTDRIFVDYDDLLADWRAVIARIEAIMGRALPARDAKADAAIDAFLSSDQRHHRLDDADLEAAPDIWKGVLPVWRWMKVAATGAEPGPEPLDKTLADLDDHARVLGPAIADLRAEAAAFPALKAELAEVKKEAGALRDLANQFHAEADHNGRHWEAERDQTAYLRREWALALEAVEIARREAAATARARQDAALAETRALRLQAQTRELTDALERTRREATAHSEHNRAVIQGLAARNAELEAALAAASQSPEPVASAGRPAWPFGRPAGGPR